MYKSLLIFFCMLSLNGYTQNKVVSSDEMILKLNDCQKSIELINIKISAIKSRNLTLPDDQLSNSEYQYYFNQKLEQLDNEKVKQEKIQYSILAFLNKENAQSENKPIVISKSVFDKYPEENQKLILAHPERYVVE